MQSIDKKYLDGSSLYGDDMSDEQIGDWFDQEKEGYYNLTQSYSDYSAYGYSALNEHYAWRKLRGMNNNLCLVLGCADGKDVIPIAQNVSGFTVIEPAKKWWRDEIGGTPSNFVMPAASGKLALAAESHDLAISLGVLHHIPNVSAVLTEVHRVVRPGGLLILREPIHTMGDWTHRRTGLTRNERGLPLSWLEAKLTDIGFRTTERHLCMFGPLARIASRAGLSTYNSKTLVCADQFLGSIFSGNVKYHRKTTWDKLSPSNVFLIATRM